MRDIAPWLIIVGNCCIGPILIFTAGLYVGRYGSPVIFNREWFAQRRKSAAEKSGGFVVRG